ncbi:6-hydroxy-d-nicotine oxidase [Fusarium longipes]|uniref:6-hydroxy-d-nicotine oxidase n=1 Tax=Fusarium longipes TaxID=694270 RepID=A0A395T4B2_9HYPO|nr:6-hydroxy-d-nicotine oxidase [Fusarium longipes]
MTSSISGLEALECEFSVPNDSTPKLSRWSDTQIGRPALIGTPKKEGDIQAAIRVGKDNKLTVLVAGGGHGTFVSVDSSTLYLDLKHFKTFDLNKEKRIVRVGGGVTTGEVVKALAAEGYYTPVPNSDAVGFVGCVLGGGNGVLGGLHGWMVDNVVSFRVITAEGGIVEVSADSKGKELALFDALRGAGHGLGVVTEVTVSAFPIADLNMDDNKIWTRTLIFPAPAVDLAVKTFLDLRKPLPEGFVTMVFARSPPGTPAAGSPIIILGYTFFGPAEKAEKQAALLFQDDVVARAVMAMTDFVPFASINAKNEVYNSHGGHKAIASCRLYKTDSDVIKSSFERWKSATQEYPDAQQTPLIISAFNTDKSVTLNGNNFIESRDRPLNAFVPVIAKEEETNKAFMVVLDSIIAGLRKSDVGAGPRSFANNWRFETDVNEMFSEEMFERLRGIKKSWDGEVPTVICFMEATQTFFLQHRLILMEDLTEHRGRGQPVEISEFDKSGNFVRLWSHEAGDRVSLKAEARTSLPSMREAFMPVGYPHSVSSDYLNYQFFDSMQAFFSTITSLLANRALLEGLGVGDANSSATFAMLLTVLKDAISRIATIVFAHKFGLRIEPDAKRFRFLADLFNDTAFFMELYSPYLGPFGKIIALTTGEALRALCGVAAGASKAALSVHFAKHDNLAELNAKEASQETAIGLIGLAVGTLVVNYVEDHNAVVCLMIVLVLAHLWMNYLGVRSVCMDNFNRQRATILFEEYLNNGNILSPEEVAQRESILFWRPIVRGRRIEIADSYGKAMNGRVIDVINNRGSTLFIGPDIKIMLWKDSTSIQALDAWFAAVKVARQGEKWTATATGLEEGGGLLEGIRAKGWKLGAHALETSAPTRLSLESAAKKDK